MSLLLVALLAGCGKTEDKAGRGKGPVEVGYVVVQPTTVALEEEFAGRAVAFQSSEVRPQVDGVIQRRLFTEGALVKAGQPLYQIDPSLYAAAVNQAQANLVSAQASAGAARTLAERYGPLAKAQAISAQDYTEAQAADKQAAAAVGQAQAALDTARINLRFTTVPAPIDGRIGRSLSTVGALVTSSQASPLATIQQLDPIYIDVQQSSADLTRLRRQLASGGAEATSAPVRVKLEDGSAYADDGVLEFSEVVVDPTTGTVTLRVRVPNPDGLVLPGMFLRATFAQSSTASAFLVPQAAVARDPQGKAQVTLVDANGKAVTKTVTAARSLGANWVVTDGLAAGDRVVTQGLANLRSDSILKAVPADTPETIGAAAKGGPAPPPAPAGSAR